MSLNEDKLLDDFKEWIQKQDIYVIPDHPLMNEQIDDAPLDYILDFCEEKKYSEKTTESLLDWIELRNEVFVFLEKNGFHYKDRETP